MILFRPLLRLVHGRRVALRAARPVGIVAKAGTAAFGTRACRRVARRRIAAQAGPAVH